MAMSSGSYSSRVVATAVVATDGTGDFTDIQAAIDSLPAGGGVVYIKEGTYTITTTLTITSDNIALIGAGKASKIQAGSNLIILEIGTQVDVTEVAQSGTFISQLYFFGDDKGSSTVGIKARIENSRISDCWVTDCNNGIEVRKGADNTISNCTIIDNNNHGIMASAAASRLRVIGCEVSSNAAKGMSISGVTNSVFSNNTVRSNSDDGISFTTNVDESVISDNVVVLNGGDGIIITDNSDQNVISGNVSIGNTDDEINIAAATCDDTIVTQNNCKGGTISDSGTGTEIGHNIL